VEGSAEGKAEAEPKVVQGGQELPEEKVAAAEEMIKEEL